MQESAISLLFILLFIGGSIWLQIFLSRNINKWLGLIIPVIFFVFSIVIVFSLGMYSNITESSSVIEISNGVEVTQKAITTQSEKPSVFPMLMTALPIFLVFNIPTAVFLAIYFYFKGKIKIRNELDKMNVRDLY